MTIRYKSETFDLVNTDVTNILTCPADATIIVKLVQANHKAASNVDVDLFLRKSDGSADIEIAHKQLNKASANLIDASLNLEASDILKLQAGSGNVITGCISYAQIDRSQENG